MNFIDKLALRSAEITALNLSDNSIIEQVIKKHKNKDVSLNKTDIISVLNYGYTALYGELFKSIIVLFISLLFHIFIPTFVVMLSFSIMRAFIGGKHLHSSGKCLILTSILLIGSGWVANVLTSNLDIPIRILGYIVIGILLELISLTKPFEWMLKKLDGEKI